MDEENLIWLIRQCKWKYFSLTNQSRFLRSLHKVDTQLPKCFDRAVFNFAIDFELFWGNSFKNGSDMSVMERVDNARIGVESIISLRQMLINLEMPATWAIVGKLMEPDLKPLPEKSFKPAWLNTDWYTVPDSVPKEYYEARSFIQDLKKHPYFELVSHGFGHIEFADPSVTSEIAHEDMRLAQNVLKDIVTTKEAFIYSSNKINHSNILADLKYHIVRGDENKWQINQKEQVIRTPEGFWVSPAMLSLKDAVKMVDLGIKNKSFIHPWSHPRDVNSRAKDIERFYRPFFEYVKKQQKAGNLEILSFHEMWKSISQVTFS